MGPSATEQLVPSVVQILEGQCLAHPDRICVGDGSRTLTFGELDERSDRLARRLVLSGVEPGSIVGICLDRSIAAIIAVVGTLKVGAAYLPLDPTHPGSRLGFMIADAAPVVVVTEYATQDRLPAATPVLCVDRASPRSVTWSGNGFTGPLHAASPAYVVYTSGTTGTPKGVVVPHRALAAHVRAVSESFDLDESDRVLQFASLSFDVAAEELFPTWARGGAVVLAPPMIESFRHFDRFLREEQLTVVNLPTPFWHGWVNHLERDPSAGVPDSLRLVVVGSDTASPEHLRTWRRLVDDRVRWLNAYGVTETTITATTYEPTTEAAELDRSVVAVGRPLDHVTVSIVDDAGEAVADGEVGELVIGGEGVASGYLNRPELTRERFVPDPARPGSDRLVYRTGDLVRWRADRNLEFLGRFDDQVKIRGIRVERGEIESVLASHPSVEQAVVLARRDALRAFVTIRPDRPLEVGELQDLVSDRFPTYMRPASFAVVEAIPVTSNGKIDHESLLGSTGSGPSGRPPPQTGELTPTERDLLRIWCRVLGDSTIGMADDFFDLGGHSLRALELVSDIETEMGVTLPLSTFLEAPTVAALARVIDHRDPAELASLIVPLRPGGVDAPLFLVHADASVMFYRPLARRLSACRSVYGVQAPTDMETAPRSIEGRATLYLDAIREVQPAGPYLLAGYSMGGLFAYEMARQLVAAGETVSFFGAIDGRADYRAGEKTRRERLANLALNLSLRRHGPHGVLAYVRERTWERIRTVVNRARASIRERLGSSVPPDIAYVRAAVIHREMTDAYRALPSSVPVTLFLAEHQPSAIDSDDYFGWRSVARSGFNVEMIPATHHTLMTEPDVAALAEQLQAGLDRA